MSRIIRFSLMGSLVLLAWLAAAVPAQAMFRPNVRVFAVRPIPNVNMNTVFFSKFSGRAFLYVPPSNGNSFATVLTFGSANQHMNMQRQNWGYGMNGMPGYGMMSSGYGMMSSGYGMMGYGGGGGGSSRPTPYYVPVPQADSSSPLDALALPHSGNQLLWPLGLRIVPPALETQPLLLQTQAQILTVAREAVYGQVDAGMVQQALESVQRLRKYLKEGETKMSQSTAAEAQRFLNLLETTLQRYAGEG